MGIAIYLIVEIFCRTYRYSVKRGRGVFLAVISNNFASDPKEGASWHRFGTLALCERGEDGGKRFMNCLGLNYEVKMVGAWNGMWALAHCPRIDGEGVARCSGKFSEEIKIHFARLRSEFFTKKKRLGSD